MKRKIGLKSVGEGKLEIRGRSQTKLDKNNEMVRKDDLYLQL